MGWWIGDEEGNSLQASGVLAWGDEPADIIDAALDAIDDAFFRRFARRPTLDELKAGLLFSARVRYEKAG